MQLLEFESEELESDDAPDCSVCGASNAADLDTELCETCTAEGNFSDACSRHYLDEDVARKWLEYQGFDIDDIDDYAEQISDAYYGAYGSKAVFAENYVSDVGDAHNIPDYVVIDWEATWDALAYDFFEIDDGYGGVHIFRDC